jgi:hypothetical protein
VATQTLVNVTLLAAVAVSLAALALATLLYVQRRKPKSGTGRRSALLFAAGTLTSGIALGYLGFLHLPWPLCAAFDRFSDGTWCALAAYVAAPIGFTMGTLAFAGAWSLNGTAP